MNKALALLDLPAHVRQRLLSSLENGVLSTDSSATTVRNETGVTQGVEAVTEGLAELKDAGIEGRAAATWLRAVEEVTSRTLRPDLVWSGPEVPGVHARDTRVVYEELFSNANRSIFASTYAFFDGPSAFKTIANRMEAVPHLEVNLLLNIRRERGDTSKPDAIVRRFTDRFWKTDWPGEARPSVYYDPRSLEPEGPGGVLHAKGTVVDDEAVFITSANLTEAALDRNLELGVLIRDRVLALSVASHFRILISGGHLRPLPSS